MSALRAHDDVDVQPTGMGDGDRALELLTGGEAGFRRAHCGFNLMSF